MKRFRLVALAGGLFILWLSVFPALGVERFPPPDFETDYTMPQMTTPGARASLYNILDTVVLLITLSLATWLALKNRSRKAVFTLMVFSLIYFGFWREGCVCPIGAIQNISLALFDSNYAIPVTVMLFFLLPIIFTLFFGRAFCAAVCPLGAIQDVVLLQPLQVPSWLDQVLGLLAYVYLAAAILFAATGSGFIICRYDPFVAFFRLEGSNNIIVLGICFLIIGVFVGRPYCRYLCPYGAILRLAGAVSKFKVTITPSHCTNCKLCQETCPFGAIQVPAEVPAKTSIPSARRRLLLLLAALPLVAVLFGGLGLFLSVPFSRMHPTVRLAERVHLNETVGIDEPDDSIDAFVQTGQPVFELYENATQIQHQFKWATVLFGVFLGLVIGFKLIQLSIYRPVIEYQAHRSRCLACGRCFIFCPLELERRGLPVPQHLIDKDAVATS